MRTVTAQMCLIMFNRSIKCCFAAIQIKEICHAAINQNLRWEKSRYSLASDINTALMLSSKSTMIKEGGGRGHQRRVIQKRVSPWSISFRCFSIYLTLICTCMHVERVISHNNIPLDIPPFLFHHHHTDHLARADSCCTFAARHQITTHRQ